MSIKDWPEESGREKLLQLGPQVLSDAELMAIFKNRHPRKSAVELARETLHRFGSLNALLGSSLTQFCQMPGLGSAKYAQLQAVVELTRRYLQENLHTADAVSSPDGVRAYLQYQMRHLEHEQFSCLYLNAQNQVLAFEPLFRGTIDSASVYPREVVKQALLHNAKSVIAVHNHPSGCPDPARQTLRLQSDQKAHWNWWT